MLDRHGLQPREAVKRLETLFASVARLAAAAEGQFDAAAGAVIVDEALAAEEEKENGDGEGETSAIES